MTIQEAMEIHFRRRKSSLAVGIFSGLLGLSACDGGTAPTLPPTPASLAVAAGDQQTAVAGNTVAISPAVLLMDTDGKPMGGARVTFTVASGAGAVAGGSATTDAGGVARAGGWTLGKTAGSNTLSVSVPGLAPITFTATGAAGAPASISITAGDGQTAPVAAAVATAPSVVVKDANGNAVLNVVVTFAVATGGGSVTGASATTDATGTARVARWMLGSSAGAQTLMASVGDAIAPVTFSATAVAAAPASLALHAGNGQTNTVGAPVGVTPSVVVKDAFLNPVPNVAVVFGIRSGGGTIVGATQTTNGAGIAAVSSWILGTTAGANVVSASVQGLPTLDFVAIGTPAAPASVSISAGNGQTVPVATPVAIAPSVIVKDAYGNFVPNVPVTFAVALGGGSITDAQTTTDSTGNARIGKWQVGMTVGTQALTASVPGLPAVTFTASAVAGEAATVSIHAGDAQSATAGSAPAEAPSVVVKDAYGNPVPNVTVVFAVIAGGGTVGRATQTTNSSGIAAVDAWTLGTLAGANSLSATVSALAPVSFRALGTAGPPANISGVGGDGQTAPVASNVTPPSVVVRDVNGNVVANVRVTFAVTTGGGSVNSATAITNGSGVATAGSWTLGTTVGTQTLTASVAGLAAVMFSATATAGASATLSIIDGNNQSVIAGATLPGALSVIVRDAFSNPVPNVSVVFTPVAGSGTVTGSAQKTNAAGMATLGSWTISGGAGTNTLSATVSGLTSVSFVATGRAGAPASIAASAGNGQTAVVGSVVGITPSVVVKDGNGNPVVNVNVRFAVTAGGGSVSGGNATTDASGSARVTSWTLGTTVGAQALTATVAGIPSSTFAATSIAGAPANLSINAGNNQSALAGSALPVSPSVIVRDAFSNPVPNATVSFSVTAGGGTISSPLQLTSASGAATLGSWTLGAAAGTNTMTAHVGGLAAVTFTATSTLVAPPVPTPGGYNISIRFLTAPNARQQLAVERAAARWQQVITADLSDVPVSVPASSCGANAPAINETIDDILIYVDFRSIDGPGLILGQAGPCFVRGSNGLPLIGTVQLDGADLATMESNGTIDDVVLHEIGHVLGIGTVWQGAGVLAFAATDTVTFTGFLAGAAFTASGGSVFNGRPVPVENCVGISSCGSGTRDSHWRERVMGRELMTGYISAPGNQNPLSRITIQSLADIGYTVNAAAADAFTMGANLRYEAELPAIELHEVTPDWKIRVVDDAGQCAGVNAVLCARAR